MIAGGLDAFLLRLALRRGWRFFEMDF